jgi:ankyrin repeat protein
MWHKDEEIEAAFSKDPSLFKVRNSVGTNVAMVAAAEGSPKVLDFMVQHGADIHALTRVGHDVLYCAVMENNPEMVEHVVKLGFSVNERFGPSKQTPLIVAVQNSCLNSVKWLLANGADPNAVDADNMTPLIKSFYSRSVLNNTIFDRLVAAKADLHYRLPNGLGLLHLAIDANDPLTVDKLISLGISVNDAAPKTLVTPLMVAAITQSDITAKWLISKGADVNAVDARGRSVFDYAKLSNTLGTDRFFRQDVGLPQMGGWDA